MRTLTVNEVEDVSGASFSAGKAIGTAIRVAAVAGVAGVATAAGLVAVALVVDYALDGEFDLLKK